MSKAFDPYNHFGFLTNRVARLISTYLRPEVQGQGHDMPTSCIGVLADLWRKDGVTQKELGMSIIKNKSSVNKMLATLESEGLVYKADHPEDKRNKLIFLTENGKAMESCITEADQKAESKLLDGISKEDIATAKKVLTILYQNLSTEIQLKQKDEKH